MSVCVKGEFALPPQRIGVRRRDGLGHRRLRSRRVFRLATMLPSASPAVPLQHFTCGAKTFAIVLPKIVDTVSDCDLLTDFNVASAYDLHAVVARSRELGIGVAVMVGKSGRTKEERWRLLSARHDDAKIAVLQIKLLFLLLGHGDLNAGQVLDDIPFLDLLSSEDGSLVGSDRVSVCSAHLEGTVRHVDAHISTQMALEMFFLVLCLERLVVLLQAREIHELLRSSDRVLVKDDMILYDATNILLSNASHRMETGTQFANLSPV